jgi:hypothetical protein
MVWLSFIYPIWSIPVNDYQEDLLDFHAAEWEPVEPVDDATEL